MRFRSTPLRSSLAALALVALLHPAARAEDEKLEFPQPSQLGVVKQRVGLTDVEVEYSRPNKNDREIFGGLVPYGKLWRTGANAPTKVRFSKAVKLDGKEIPAGEYALFTIPTAAEWTVIISKDAKVQSAADYKEENDAARVMVKPTVLPASVETFTIGLADVKAAAATFHLDWDKTRVALKLTTDDVEQIAKQLDAMVQANKTIDPRLAYQAAGFYFDNGKDLKQAEKWIDEALQANPKAYFMHFRRAQIEAKLGNKKEAKESAERTIEILKADKNPDEAAIGNAQRLIESLR